MCPSTPVYSHAQTATDVAATGGDIAPGFCPWTPSDLPDPAARLPSLCLNCRLHGGGDSLTSFGLKEFLIAQAVRFDFTTKVSLLESGKDSCLRGMGPRNIINFVTDTPVEVRRRIGRIGY